MDNKQAKQGFTLIELLVVVLIIGILAAVALPQYQQAVEKSRAAEALVILKNAQQARVLDYLEHGSTNPSKPQDIMDFSGGVWNEGGDRYCTKNFTYFFDDCTIADAYRVDRTDNTCTNTDNLQPSYEIDLLTPYDGENWQNRKGCLAHNDIGYKVCKGLESQGFEVDDGR